MILNNLKNQVPALKNNKNNWSYKMSNHCKKNEVGGFKDGPGISRVTQKSYTPSEGHNGKMSNKTSSGSWKSGGPLTPRRA